MDDTRLLDLGNYPEIQADGLGDVMFHEGKAHFVLFGWRRIDGVWRRVIVGLIIRPASSLLPEQTIRLREMFAAGDRRVH